MRFSFQLLHIWNFLETYGQSRTKFSPSEQTNNTPKIPPPPFLNRVIGLGGFRANPRQGTFECISVCWLGSAVSLGMERCSVWTPFPQIMGRQEAIQLETRFKPRTPNHLPAYSTTRPRSDAQPNAKPNHVFLKAELFVETEQHGMMKVNDCGTAHVHQNAIPDW